MKKPIKLLALLLLGALMGPLSACAGPGQEEEGEAEAMTQEPITLGPVDGRELAATDLERVAVGSVAPDFSLQTISGDTLTLSSFRGEKDVVLVFYRGHW